MLDEDVADAEQGRAGDDEQRGVSERQPQPHGGAGANGSPSRRQPVAGADEGGDTGGSPSCGAGWRR